VLGQSGHHGGSRSGNSQGSSTATADNPDLTDFKHAVAVQATDEQQTKFKMLAQYTDAARKQVQVLEQPALEDAVKHANALQDSLDEVHRQDLGFLNTFSDTQVSGLKKQTKNVTQSDAAVAKEAKKLAAQLDRTEPDFQRLSQSAVHLGQALSQLQSDQNGLAREMGIETH